MIWGDDARRKVTRRTTENFILYMEDILGKSDELEYCTDSEFITNHWVDGTREQDNKRAINLRKVRERFRKQSKKMLDKK
ncbi:hypothetical protein K8R62_01875 [bacterium]|nr:hypothetical protein [bacterium]